MNLTVKVVCRGMGLKMMVLRSPTVGKEGQDWREGWERTGKDSNINPPKNISWTCSVLRCPTLVLGLSAQRKREKGVQDRHF